MENDALTLAGVGEKEIIRRFIRPLFNPESLRWGVGDDCAMVDLQAGHSLLVSTDRVPSDLRSFCAGVLDYEGLGRYLVRLNLSDIAACGGSPLGLLLTLGLPRTMLLEDFQALLKGVAREAASADCPILGGDMSDSSEVSISATAFGQIRPVEALSRQTCQPGDTIFVSRPIGLTPAAFAYLDDRARLDPLLPDTSIEALLAQFTSLPAMLELGKALSKSGRCTSCMDNTDGLSQTLHELAENSMVAFQIQRDDIVYPPALLDVCRLQEVDPIELAFDAGADFSLVGTMAGNWTNADLQDAFGPALARIGFVEPGSGVFIGGGGKTEPLPCRGWNYYKE